MNRLTTWNGKKYVLPQGRTADGESYWRIIAERLAAYEDTGFTPEEIERIKGGESVESIMEKWDESPEPFKEVETTDYLYRGYLIAWVEHMKAYRVIEIEYPSQTCAYEDTVEDAKKSIDFVLEHKL